MKGNLYQGLLEKLLGRLNGQRKCRRGHRVEHFAEQAVMFHGWWNGAEFDGEIRRSLNRWLDTIQQAQLNLRVSVAKLA